MEGPRQHDTHTRNTEQSRCLLSRFLLSLAAVAPPEDYLPASLSLHAYTYTSCLPARFLARSATTPSLLLPIT